MDIVLGVARVTIARKAPAKPLAKFTQLTGYETYEVGIRLAYTLQPHDPREYVRPTRIAAYLYPADAVVDLKDVEAIKRQPVYGATTIPEPDPLLGPTQPPTDYVVSVNTEPFFDGLETSVDLQVVAVVTYPD